jgi:hypothetical protein
MISDVLCQAVEDIAEWRRDWPDAYDDFSDELDEVVEKMEAVRKMLDKPPQTYSREDDDAD